jgi:hypothetical protein
MRYLLPTQLDRDPFARSTLLRQTLPPEDREPCAWCGSRPGRFAYYWEQDTGWRPMPRAFQLRGFCCVTCWRSFTT